jgi:hypothetical protein
VPGVLPVVASTNPDADRMNHMTPYNPAYPFADSPQALSGKLNAARRFHPAADHTDAEDRLAASRCAYAVARIMADHGRPLPDDLAAPVAALLTGAEQ